MNLRFENCGDGLIPRIIHSYTRKPDKLLLLFFGQQPNLLNAHLWSLDHLLQNSLEMPQHPLNRGCLEQAPIILHHDAQTAFRLMAAPGHIELRLPC
ncbi:hypothetical protein D3C77_265180 [compost metagenome]